MPVPRGPGFLPSPCRWIWGAARRARLSGHSGARVPSGPPRVRFWCCLSARLPVLCRLRPVRPAHSPAVAVFLCVYTSRSCVGKAAGSCINPRSGFDSLPQPRFAEASLSCASARAWPGLLQLGPPSVPTGPAACRLVPPPLGAPEPEQAPPAVLGVLELLHPLGGCPLEPFLLGT